MAVPLKDEMVLNVDGILAIDPALGLRQRAQALVGSRKWSTPSVFCGDQPEPEESETGPMWSMCFCLGLDHVPKSNADWFADVAAIVEFLQPVAQEAGCEFIVEFRLKSRLWYSETLDFITSTDKVDLPGIRMMLEHFTAQKRWWRVSDPTFKLTWSRERMQGRVRFILTRGVLPWGLILGLGCSALAGRGVTGLFPPLRVVLWFIAGLLFGVCVGALRWVLAERRYQNLSASHEPPPHSVVPGK